VWYYQLLVCVAFACVCTHLPRVHVYVRMPERIWQVVVYERESVRVMSFLLEYC
jgi:hypothetical protein